LRVWLLSFESKDTVKVGGLAEVPPRLGEALKSLGFDVKLLTPSHGFAESRKSELKHVASVTVQNTTIDIYDYSEPAVTHIIFSSKTLDYPEVYSPAYLMGKAVEFALGVRAYAEIAIERGELPSIVHGNDWHSVPALLALNSLFAEKQIGVKLFYQIHLLTGVVFSFEDVSSRIGLEADSLIRGVFGVKTLREYYELSQGRADRLGALICDKTVTVSMGYVKEVVRRLGLDLESRVDYIPNATTWNLEEVIWEVGKHHPELATLLDADKVAGRERTLIRDYFLTKGLAKLNADEPVVEDKIAADYVKSLKTPPFRGNGLVEPFEEPGPMVLMTGRLSRQKGLHVLLKALEEVVIRIPEIKIVLLLLPVWSERKLLESVAEASILYRENLRVVFGRAPSIYGLAHLASNIAIAPSVYEPFGLVALEAMVTGNPVVASKTGGLAETVLDITLHGLKGTGLHVVPGDPADLAEKTADLALFTETLYREPWSNEWLDLVDRISSRALKSMLMSNPEAPRILRKSCFKRAGEYTWRASAERAVEVYGLKAVRE